MNQNAIFIALVNNLGLIIGKPILEAQRNGAFLFVGLKNPRTALMNKQNDDLKFVALIGEPEEFMFGSDKPVHYEVKDKKILSLYTDEVSGIKVTSHMPPDVPKPAGPILVKP